MFIKWCAIYVLVGAIILSVYVTSVILRTPLVLNAGDLSNQTLQLTTDVMNIWEKGSLAQKDQLRTYQLFAEVQNEVVETIELEEDLVEFTKDFSIPLLLKNDCLEIYCYQHRTSFSKVPSSIWKSLIGVEDTRFIQHQGVDPKAILRAIVADLKAMSFVQGGSTLTQQLVKNVLLSNEKSIERKLKEMILSIFIELKFSKQEILEIYLNEVYWGAIQGIRIKGIYAASLFYFDKKIEEVDFYESIILISMLRGPHFYSPLKDFSRLRDRVNTVKGRILQAGIAVESELKEWSEIDWAKWQKKLQIKSENHELYDIWRVTKMGSTFFNHFENFVFQYSVSKILKSQKIQKLKKDFAVKSIILDLKDRNRYFEYYSKYERPEYKAIYEEVHQVGSVLKPIIFFVLKKNGVSLDEIVSTAPFELDLLSGKWIPKEPYAVLPEEISLKEALRMSLNGPLVRKVFEHGIEKVESELKKLIPELELPLKEFPAQLLGTIELTPKRLLEIYSVFIKQACEDNDGEFLNILNDPLKTTIKKSVDHYLREMSFFGKTGTSNGSYDNWFVFFEGRMIGVIWLGVETGRDGSSLGLSGSSTSFKIFQTFMRTRAKRFNEFGCELLNN